MWNAKFASNATSYESIMLPRGVFVLELRGWA
jgi:hypothetical protein